MNKCLVLNKYLLAGRKEERGGKEKKKEASMSCVFAHRLEWWAEVLLERRAFHFSTIFTFSASVLLLLPHSEHLLVYNQSIKQAIKQYFHR